MHPSRYIWQAGESERKAFREMMARDRKGRAYTQFLRECAREVHEEREQPKEVLCGGCQTRHEKKYFSPAQLAKKPEERVCRGREGRVRICEHWSLDFEELMVVKRTGVSRYCNHADHVQEDQTARPALGNVSKRFKPVLTTYICVLTMPREMIVPPWQVVSEALKVELLPCPHMKVHDADMSKQIRCLGKHLCSDRGRPHSKGDAMAARIRCKTKGCDAEVRLHRYRASEGRDEDEIWLRRKRTLGKLKAPLDACWLTAIE